MHQLIIIKILTHPISYYFKINTSNKKILENLFLH